MCKVKLFIDKTFAIILKLLAERDCLAGRFALPLTWMIRLDCSYPLLMSSDCLFMPAQQVLTQIPSQ